VASIAARLGEFHHTIKLTAGDDEGKLKSARRLIPSVASRERWSIEGPATFISLSQVTLFK
jgi:hypothetical protein